MAEHTSQRTIESTPDGLIVSVMRAIIAPDSGDETTATERIRALRRLTLACRRFSEIVEMDVHAASIWRGVEAINIINAIIPTAYLRRCQLDESVIHGNEGFIKAALRNCNPRVHLASVTSHTVPWVLHRLPNTTELNLEIPDNISNAAVVAAILNAVSTMHSLKKLRIRIGVTTGSVAYAGPLPNSIEELDIKNNKMDLMFLVEMGCATNWANLRRLCVTPMSHERRKLATMPHLRELCLENDAHCAYSSGVILNSVWESAPILEVLKCKVEFDNHAGKYKGFDGLRSARCRDVLRKIKLSSRDMSGVSGDGLDALNSCSSLCDVKVVCSNASPDDLSAIVRVRALTTLSIGGRVLSCPTRCAGMQCSNLSSISFIGREFHRSDGGGGVINILSDVSKSKLRQVRSVTCGDVVSHMPLDARSCIERVSLVCNQRGASPCAYRLLPELLVSCKRVTHLRFSKCEHCETPEFASIIKAADRFAESVRFVEVWPGMCTDVFSEWGAIQSIRAYTKEHCTHERALVDNTIDAL